MPTTSKEHKNRELVIERSWEGLRGKAVYGEIPFGMSHGLGPAWALFSGEKEESL